MYCSVILIFYIDVSGFIDTYFTLGCELVSKLSAGYPGFELSISRGIYLGYLGGGFQFCGVFCANRHLMAQRDAMVFRGRRMSFHFLSAIIAILTVSQAIF